MQEIIAFFLSEKVLSILLGALTTLVLWKLTSVIFRRLLQKNQMLHLKFIQRIVQAIIMLAGICSIAYQFSGTKQLFQMIIASGGVLTVIVGLASQESIGNIIAGFFITMFKPFELGDRVILKNSNITGYIEDITLRHTIIRTFTNSRVTIPNSVINKEIVENYQLVDARSSNFVDVSITYDSDISKAQETMAKVICRHPEVLDMRTPEQMEAEEPQVRVLVRELSASAIELRATVWTATVDINFRVCSEIRAGIVQAFREDDIAIAFPTMTIYKE